LDFHNKVGKTHLNAEFEMVQIAVLEWSIILYRGEKIKTVAKDRCSRSARKVVLNTKVGIFKCFIRHFGFLFTYYDNH